MHSALIFLRLIELLREPFLDQGVDSLPVLLLLCFISVSDERLVAANYSATAFLKELLEFVGDDDFCLSRRQGALIILGLLFANVE